MKISLQTFIIILVVLSLAAVLGLFVFFNQQTSTVGGQPGNIFGNLFPFGGGNSSGNNGGNQEPNDQQGFDREVPLLRQVVDVPVSGGYVYQNGTGAVLIRYVERETGHIYEVEANGYNTTRITNTTIPGIQEVVWINENNLIIRYLSDGAIENFYVELDPQKTEQTVNGSFVPDWEHISLDKETGQIFTKTITSSGSLFETGSVRGNKRVVLSSPLFSLIPLQNSRSLFVLTAPNSTIPGSLFEIVGGSLRLVVGERLGLSVNPNPENSFGLMSYVEQNRLQLSSINFNTGEVEGLPLQTLATKCAWISTLAYCGAPLTAPSNLPETWEVGEFSFDDSLWSLDVQDRRADFIIDPLQEVGVSLDVWQPMIDKTGSYLIFINKRDLTLWSLRIKDEAVSEEGGEN